MQIVEINDPNVIARLNEPVQNLHHSLYPSIFKPYHYKNVLAYYEKIINFDNHHFVVCKEDDEEIGYIWFEEIIKPDTAFSFSSHYIYIHQISVNENKRSIGVGKLLFNSVLDLAKEKSIKRIGLDYWVKNGMAKSIYAKMGFEIEREVTYLNI